MGLRVTSAAIVLVASVASVAPVFGPVPAGPALTAAERGTVRSDGRVPPLTGLVDESAFRLGDTVWVGGGVVRGSDRRLTPNNRFVRLDRSGRAVGTAIVPVSSAEYVFWADAAASGENAWVLGNLCRVPRTDSLGCSEPRQLLWRVDDGERLTEASSLPELGPEAQLATLVGTHGAELLIATSTSRGAGRLHRVRPGSGQPAASVALPVDVDPQAGVCQRGRAVFAARNVTTDGLSLTGVDIVGLAVDELGVGSPRWSPTARIAHARRPTGTTWLACGQSELGVASAGPEPWFVAVSAATGAVTVPVDNPVTGQDEQVVALDYDAGSFLVTTRSARQTASYWTYREGRPTVRLAASRALTGADDLPRALVWGDSFVDVSPRTADGRVSPYLPGRSTGSGGPGTPQRAVNTPASPAIAHLRAAGSPTLWMPGRPVSAGAHPTTWTHNICGALGCGHLGDPVVLDPLKRIITAQAAAGSLPSAVGVQEACRQQQESLGWFLLSKNANYRMASYDQLILRDGCGSATPHGYGVAVYALGARTARGGAFAAQHENDNERRGWACIRSVSSYAACTAHMSSGRDDSDNPVQWRQFLQFVGIKTAFGQVSESDSTFWGGDFNVAPQGITERLPSFFAGNPEADMCEDGAGRPTHSGGGKIDYAFRDRPADCSQDAAVIPAATSDHMLLGGHL